MSNSKDICVQAENLLTKADETYFKYKNELFDNQNAFNIFSILRNEHEEVKLHSTFIAELLSPTGSHYLKNTFLELFLKNCGISTFNFPEDCKKIKVDVEKSDENRGKIDIFIDNPDYKQAIIIENKIYAGDQPEQLKRYYEYAHKTLRYEKKNISIIYLTLYGYEPTNDSKGDIPDDVITCVAYKNVIDEWITECIKASALKPTIRETLKQYQNLIRKLTGKSMSDNYTEDLKKLLEGNLDNIYLAHDMSKALTEVKIDIQAKFWRELREALKDEGHTMHGFKSIYSNRKINTASIKQFYNIGNSKSYGLSILVKETESDAGVNDLVFHVGIYARQLFLGFTVCDKDDKQLAVCKNEEYNSVFQKLINKEDKLKSSSDDYWIAWKYVENNDIFNYLGERDGDMSADGEVGKEFIDKLAKEIDGLIKIAKGVM